MGSEMCIRDSIRYVHRMSKELVIPDPWECIQCGMCCKRYDPETDSIMSCQYLQEDNSCGIYETRPIACRMDWHGPSQAKIDHCNLAIMSIQQKMTVFDLIQLCTAVGKGEVTLDG